MSNLLFFLLMLIPFAGFIWSSLFYFNHGNEKNIELILIKFCGLFTILANLILIFLPNSVIFEIQIFGGAFILISSLLFYWAINSNKKKSLSFAFTYIEISNLNTSGVYKYMRHPLYSSYIFGWLGGFFINQHWILIPTSCLLVFLYFKSIKNEEDGFLNGPNREKYFHYMQTTGRLLPKLFHVG